MPTLTLTTENVLKGKVESPLLRRWYVYTANKEVGTYLLLLTDTHFDNDKLLGEVRARCESFEHATQIVASANQNLGKY